MIRSILRAAFEPIICALLIRSAKQWQSDEVICEQDRPKKRLLELRPRLDAEMRARSQVVDGADDLATLLQNAPPHESMVGQAWSTEDERLLARLYRMGAGVSEMAIITGRRKGGITARLEHLQLVVKVDGALFDAATNRGVRP